MAEFRGWLRRNWTTPVILLAIFLVALYLRAYFPWDLAVGERLLSGGSDSFYYERIINYNVETGQQLVRDCRLNYPMCLVNPRPPLYSWTVAVLGKSLSPLFGDVWTSVTFVFLGSTALWGALTVFPMYFLTKEAFGRRAAILASFFLAVLPAHLQRSPATNADHDAMVLFFVVTGFFFFLKSLKSLHERTWVADWSFWTKDGRSSIRTGIRGFFAENRTAVLYALLAGWCLTAVALIWQGWAYAPIVLLVYFLFQILVHRFRNQDPMGVGIVFTITVGLPLLAAFPWYYSMGQIAVWYDVPLYLFLAAVGLGLVFTVTRDYPWALVIPVVVLVGGVSLVVLSVFYPAIATAFVSGAGYFVRTKAYETIAEAQPPGLSQVILSFGVATYFLALFGLLWMARGIPKHPTPDYLFVVVWAIAAIFMAQAAARFIFNASPAFAMTSAWVTVLLVEWLRFDEARKTFRSLGSGFSAFRRSVKVRHVLGSSVILFILLVPNVWFGVDASIPYEKKGQYDRQVYDAYPDFWKPQDYDAITAQGSSFFFGAFGYSLPLTKEYFPAAWEWFREQDKDVLPVERRPAFLSWWDYGFEAVDVGAHPTVADNFLNGYHLAGNFITAQGEAEAVALLDMRILEGDFRTHGNRFTDPVKAALTARGVAWQALEDVFRHPESYIPVIDADPYKYLHHETLQAYNALYIYGGQLLMDALDADGLADLNHALRAITQSSIRYFAVDTRLFPLDGSNTGIFYAPAKLSDHRILELRDGRSIPIDFFNIRAATQRGTIDLADVGPDDQVTNLLIAYKDMFYNSMFYRAYVGFSPKVAGQDCNDCIPGLPSATNQQIQNIPPMQAWNLSHFRLAYKTAYYNPFPGPDVANHTDAWQAMDYAEAAELQGKINRGEAQGVVDLSAASAMRRGIVIIKYYDGAFLNGTVRLDGVPWPGVRVTVHDELGIPHDSELSDADGRYSVLLPFGDIHVQATIGTPDNRTLVGPTTVHAFELAVSDAAAMREDVDANGDGIPDWLVARDMDLDGETLDGFAYVDADRDGTRDPTDPVLGDAEVTLERTDGVLTRVGRTGADGRLFVEGLYAGGYDATIEWEGRTLAVSNITISEGQGALDLAVRPSILEGYVLDPAGRKVGEATVVATDAANGTAFRARAAADGFFSFPTVLPGAFDLTASEGARQSLPTQASIAPGADRMQHNVTVYPSATATVRTTLGGVPQGFVTVTFEQRSARQFVRVVTTGADGQATVALPAGTWDVHARHYSGSALWAFVGSLSVDAGTSPTYTASLEPGATVTGLLFDPNNTTSVVGGADVLFRSAAGTHRTQADLAGQFLTHLPLGAWAVQVSHLDYSFNERRTVAGTTHLRLALPKGVAVEGIAFRAFAPNATVQIEDPIPDAIVSFSDATRTYEVVTGTDGRFRVVLPSAAQFALTASRRGYLTATLPARNPFDWQGGARVALTAANVTVSGELRLGGALIADPTIPVVLRALGPGAETATAALDGAGRYAVALAPGRYAVEVDRDMTGTGEIRLQIQEPTPLAVEVGSAPIPLDLELAVRYRVDGTVTLDGQPRSPVVAFAGAEARSANATDGAFTAYLAAGSYTATANVTEGLDTFLVLHAFDVAGPTSVALALEEATNVTGTVRESGNPLEGIPVTFSRQGGGSVTATSDAFGQYHVFLLGGTYAVAVDHPGTTQAGAGVRYVRYTFSGSLTVAQGARFAVFPVDLSQALENTTAAGTVRLHGAPAAAQISFVVRGASGMNGTAASGSNGTYSVGIQPGSYDVYALAPLERGAFLGTLDLAAGAARTYDIALADAIRVSGVTTVRGSVRSAANVTFSATAGRTVVRSDAGGNYGVSLPAGTYSVEATAAGAERGVPVTYRTTASLALSDTTVLNLALPKVVRRSVDVTWDAAQRALIPAGDTVDYTVRVRNTGNEDDTVLLSATAAGFTFQFSDDRLELPFGAPGNETTVRVTITAAGDAKVDHSPISLTARSNTDSAAVKSVVLQLDIVRQAGPSLLEAKVSAAAPTWDGRFLNYTLDVRNKGNGQETYRLTLPNVGELAAAGWRATLVGAAGDAGESIDVVVAANATVRPVLRLESAGGAGGTLAIVQVLGRDDPTQTALLTVKVQMPALAVEGAIRATGTGIAIREPGIDLATAAFLVSILAVILSAVYLYVLRRRSR